MHTYDKSCANADKIKQDCAQLPMSTDYVTLLATAAECWPRSDQSIPAAWRAHNSKPTAAVCRGRMMGQTERQILDCYIDPAPHTMREGSKIWQPGQNLVLMK